MSYKFSRGAIIVGDISGSDDPDRNTGIDFGDDTISLVANGESTLVVNHDKVGIGIDDPQHRLHISGTAGTVVGLVVGDLYVTGSRAKLVVEETDGSDYRVVIDPISGPLINFGSDTADDHYMTIGAFAAKNNIDTANRDFHLYGTNTTTGFYFDESAGRFGIGTASPGSNLHVKGDDARIRIDGDTDSHPGLELSENGTRKWIIYNNYTNDNLTFKTNSNTRMSIEQDGNVGIGTASPASTLDVVGSNSRSIATITGTSNAIGESHSTVLMNADSGHCAAQLPAASGCTGRIYIFKRLDSSGNGVKIQSNGSEEIEGSTNDLDINSQYEVFTLQCDGSRWWIISDNHV